MMTPVALRGRAAGSSASIGLLVAATGLGAWLGAWRAPTGPLPEAGPWPQVLGATEASGPLAFTTVVRAAGLPVGPSVRRTVGVADFVEDDARALTVIESPGLLHQWIESLVVGGYAYARFGTDLGGHPRFSGPWLRSAGLSIPPLGVLAGSRIPSLAGPMEPVARSQARGLTEYVRSVHVSCVGGSGVPSSEDVRSVAWVDGGGRLVRFEMVTVVGEPGPPTTVTTVTTTFGAFGTRFSVRPPSPVTGPPAEPEPANPLAGCLVTPT